MAERLGHAALAAALAGTRASIEQEPVITAHQEPRCPYPQPHPGRFAEVGNGKDRFEDRLEPDVVPLFRDQVHLQEPVVGLALNLDEVAFATQVIEPNRRIVVLPAWRDTQLFTAQEQGALALAESLTELPDHESQDRAYAFARKCLTEDQLSAVSWITLTMNAFNRLSIVSEHPVRPAKS